MEPVSRETKKKVVLSNEDHPYFEVTCVVGRVYLGQNGHFDPREAAMMLIAEHHADGEYTFPENGKLVHVTVETED